MLIKAVILGVVEGLTEFLPVSSTGHLIIAGDILKFSDSFATTFDIAIQLGAIMAAVVMYWAFFKTLLPPKNWVGKSARNIIIACAPAAGIGLVCHRYIKDLLFHPIPVAIALIIGGIVLIWVDSVKKHADSPQDSVSTVTVKQALIIGITQTVSLIPGMSRSGSAIVGGLMSGLSYETSASFSFIIAVPLITAASIFDLSKSTHQFSHMEWLALGIGIITSFLIAVVSIRLMIRILKRYHLTPFGIYRIFLGSLILFLEWHT